MIPWMKSWLEAKYDGLEANAGNVRLEDCGELALSGEIVIWHPLYDLYKAPRLPFLTRPTVQAVWAEDDLAGCVLAVPGAIATWRDVGDASTDTDRFFLVQLDQAESVIAWMNEDVPGFEGLGGQRCVQRVERGDGTSTVVLESPDGNAEIRAGYTEEGQLVSAIIDV